MRVLAFNVQGFRAGVDRVADVIRATDPDVALLNEAYRAPARALASKTGRSLAFGATLRRRGFGNAVLLREAPSSVRRVRFTRTGGMEPRGAVIAVTTAGVAFASVHLGVSAAQRERHANELLEALDGLPTVVVGGDLNEQAGGPALRVLTDRFVDCFSAAGAGPGETFPATAPLRRIDCLLCSRDLVATQAAVVPIVASDHLAVEAEIERAVR